MLGQVQPWSFAVDFSCLSPNERFTPEVFLSFIYLLIFFLLIVLQLAARCAFVYVCKWQA